MVLEVKSMLVIFPWRVEEEGVGTGGLSLKMVKQTELG